MVRPIIKRPSSFFWPGLLILLPVVVLTAAGLSALRKDRVLAEQEAREQAGSLASRLAQTLGEELLRELARYRQAVYPAGFQPFYLAELPPPDAVLSPVPELNVPSDYPRVPRPPGWLAELSPQQLELWHAAQQAEFRSGDLAVARTAAQAFLATHPPPDARANAEYLLLLWQARELPAAAASVLLTASLGSWSGVVGDSGLPLRQLACYQVLQSLRDDAGLPDTLLQSVASASLATPTLLSERLIAEAVRVAGREPDGHPRGGVAALSAQWQAENRARSILFSFREQYPANSWSNGFYWLTTEENSYLVGLLETDESLSAQPSGTPPTPRWQTRIYPPAIWQRGLTNALAKAGSPWPVYASATLQLAGRDLNLGVGSQPSPGDFTPGNLLGTATSMVPRTPMVAPKFALGVRLGLARPDLLYKRQRQRTIMFGTLIATADLGALVGFFVAWSAFHRQRKLNELKSNFVASVSHELRAPIASVRLLAEGLERGKLSEPQIAGHYLRMIAQECGRLSALVENLLDFSRIEQGRKQYEFEPTDLPALVGHTVELFRAPAAEQQVSLSLTVSGDPLPTVLDGKAIQQALVNLLDNALKHSPPGSAITVGLDFALTPIPHFYLWVEDQGGGIPAAEQARIFELFYRRGSELRRETRGVGIGLSIVQHLVAGHGGKITVRSAPGRGSRFTMELPAQPLPDPTTPT